jgi:hypothetical protein
LIVLIIILYLLNVKIPLLSSIFLIGFLFSAPFLSAAHRHSDERVHSDCSICLLSQSPAREEQPAVLQFQPIPDLQPLPEAEAGLAQVYVPLFASRAPPAA